MVQRSTSRLTRKPLQISHARRTARHGSFSSNATLNLLRRFDPLAEFDWHDLSSVARQAKELKLPAGRVLVRPPRRLRGVWYLSSGTLFDESTGAFLRSGSSLCRSPVWPGHSSLRSVTEVRLLFFNEDCLPYLQTNSAHQPQTNTGSSGAALDTSEWLEILAASPLLRLLYQRRGAAGWQSWLRSLSSLEVGVDETLIEQGAVGDYFYVVQSGYAVVSGAVVSGAVVRGDVELAQIGPGGFFGEDALLSGQRRNAAVQMPAGGRVLRGDAAGLFALVDDLWWALARKPESWKCNNRLLDIEKETSTVALRDWLARLPSDAHYGLTLGSGFEVQDLLLLLMIHRGYSVVLRE